MFDTLTVARQLTDAGIDRGHAEAMADAVRQAADRGEHVTPDAFADGIAQIRIEIADSRTEIDGLHSNPVQRVTLAATGASAQNGSGHRIGPGEKGMQGATIRAERSLRAELRQGAARQLGAGATDDAIEELADRLYYGPRHKDAGKRTPMERRHEERMRQATRDALERASRR